MPRISHHLSKRCSCSSWQTVEGGKKQKAENGTNPCLSPNPLKFLQHYSVQRSQRVMASIWAKHAIWLGWRADVIIWLWSLVGASEIKCISSPLLHNKLPQSSEALNSNHLLFTPIVGRMGFWWSRLDMAGGFVSHCDSVNWPMHLCPMCIHSGAQAEGVGVTKRESSHVSGGNAKMQVEVHLQSF